MTPVFKAAIWMIGAIASFTSMAVAGRAVSAELDTFEIMLFRSVLGVFVVLSVSGLAGTLGQIRRTQLSLHFIRNLSHFVGQNLWFFALPLIPLGQLFALEFTSPIWVMLLAPLVLGEAFTGRKLIIAALGLVGVWIVTRPDFSALNVGMVAGAAAAIGFAGSALATRMLTRTQSITCIMFYLTLMQAIFGLICAGFDGDIALPSTAATPWLILIGLAGLLAHFCLTNALALAPASIVVPIDFLRLPLIFLVGWYFYEEGLDVWVLIGGMVILFANYLNVKQNA